jgi:hypothetical protein
MLGLKERKEHQDLVVQAELMEEAVLLQENGCISRLVPHGLVLLENLL